MEQDKLNILVVCKLSGHTLEENVLLPLLACNRVSCIYVLREDSADFKNERVKYILPKHNIPFLKHIARFFKGIQCCRTLKIDFIIGILNTPHGYIARTLSIFLKIPYIHMTIAGHREFWRHGPLFEKINIKYLTSGWAVTVTGTRTKDYLIKRGVLPCKIFILPNLPNHNFRRAPLKKEPSKYDIVSFSRIDKNKNVELLIRAIPLINKSDSISVAVAGDGDHLENVKQLAHQLGVDSCIEFLGYVRGLKEKMNLLCNSKIFVSCSKGEGFPVSLLEAMNCGCVPVVSDVGDISDVVKSGYNGIVYNDTDNAEQLADRLLSLLDNRERLQDMRSAALKIRDDYSVDSNGLIWNKIFSMNK